MSGSPGLRKTGVALASTLTFEPTMTGSARADCDARTAESRVDGRRAPTFTALNIILATRFPNYSGVCLSASVHIASALRGSFGVESWSAVSCVRWWLS